MGHSTGCQDIIHYLRQIKKHPKIIRVILQGPVSDRQYLCRLSSTKEQLDYCYKNKQNVEEWLPRYLHDPPLTIQRCLSLNEKNSIEDFFSSDLNDEELKNNPNLIAIKCHLSNKVKEYSTKSILSIYNMTITQSIYL